MEDSNLSKKQRNQIMNTLDKLKSNVKEISDIADINSIQAYILENKYGFVFEKHIEKVYATMKNEIPILINDETREINNFDSKYNFIIEGDNLHSLYLLAKTSKNDFDLIYIDPPYNTGAKDWKYNNDYVDKTDGYRHSKWLSMMNERLQIANSVYMNRWLGCIWQYAGIKVIPTFTWANEDTYDICFSGIEKGSIVAISTIGCINDIESYLKGFNEMKKRLNPSLIIVKGKIIKGMSGKFINLDFSDTFNVSKNYEQLSFSTINRIYEIKEEDMYGWKRH